MIFKLHVLLLLGIFTLGYPTSARLLYSEKLEGEDRVDGNDFCFNTKQEERFTDVKYADDDKHCYFCCYKNKQDYAFFTQPSKISCTIGNKEGMCVDKYCYDADLSEACYNEMDDLKSILTYGAGACKRAVCQSERGTTADILKEDGESCTNGAQQGLCNRGACIIDDY